MLRWEGPRQFLGILRNWISPTAMTCSWFISDKWNKCLSEKTLGESEWKMAAKQKREEEVKKGQNSWKSSPTLGHEKKKWAKKKNTKESDVSRWRLAGKNIKKLNFWVHVIVFDISQSVSEIREKKLICDTSNLGFQTFNRFLSLISPMANIHQ